jgi:hypothetical protein
MNVFVSPVCNMSLKGFFPMVINIYLMRDKILALSQDVICVYLHLKIRFNGGSGD